MKTLYPRLSRIALHDWLEYHPYNQEVSSDYFYISLSNKIQHEMLLIDVEDHLVGADYKYLACMLTCYLEDLISQTGMWKSFINEHYSLYGKYLPFYDMAGYEYGEINLADIQFLIWHFCSNLPTEIRFVDPYSIDLDEIARIAYAILNESAGQAPENVDLKTALTLPPDADIHKIREHLDFVFFGCYLHQYYFASLMKEEILDVKNQKDSRENFDQLLDNRRTGILFNKVTPLLAQHSGEMLAHWVGLKHPLYEKLMSLSNRDEGLFPHDEASSAHLQMKHQASGIIKREEECFLEVNYDKRIVIFERKLDTFVFIDKVWELYHLKYGMESKNRKLFDVHDLTFTIDDDLDNLVVFFNPRSGMEFYPNIAQCISIWDNTYFDKNAETDIEDLILNERVSSDFITFLINNQLIEIEPIFGKEGFHYVRTHCDFLLRYWKKERYVTEPKLFIE